MMVHKLVNIYTKLLRASHCAIGYIFLWASGAPNSRAAPDSPHSSYATASNVNIQDQPTI